MKIKTKKYPTILIVSCIVSILILTINSLTTYYNAHDCNWWLLVIKVVNQIFLGWFISTGVLTEFTKWFYKDPNKTYIIK